jgi:hypothetical protein
MAMDVDQGSKKLIGASSIFVLGSAAAPGARGFARENYKAEGSTRPSNLRRQAQCCDGDLFSCIEARRPWARSLLCTYTLAGFTLVGSVLSSSR